MRRVLGIPAFKRLTRVGLVSGYGVIVAASAPPPEAEANTPAPIVVTGTRLTPEEARKRAIEFIRGTGVANGQIPAARWADPVCPRVIGLRPDQAWAVETKMRAVARAAGIKVAGERCETNITVSFTADADALVSDVARQSPGRLSEVPAGARTALLKGLAPIRWWYSTDTRSRHGARRQTAPAPWTGIDGAEGGGSALPGSIPSIQQYNSSLLSTQVHRVLVSASVVVDADSASAMPLDALASYAAFVAFAEIRYPEFAPAGSILGLFNGDSAARELTEQDLAFLRALYRLPLDRAARYHRGFLVRDLVAARKTGG